MKDLAQVFTDPEELKVAQAICSELPKNAGSYANSKATLSMIVFNAFQDEKEGMEDDEASQFDEAKLKYIKDHKIMDILEREEHARHGGWFGTDPLYVRP